MAIVIITPVQKVNKNFLLLTAGRWDWAMGIWRQLVFLRSHWLPQGGEKVKGHHQTATLADFVESSRPSPIMVKPLLLMLFRL